MCHYLNKPITVPAQFFTSPSLPGSSGWGREGHDEHTTLRQVASVKVLHNLFFGDAFQGFEERELNDVDKCLVPVLTALNQGQNPTQASCCGHYRWESPEKYKDEDRYDPDYPWISVFVRPNIDKIEDVFRLILDLHPDWPQIGMHVDVKSWIRDSEDLDKCRWALIFGFAHFKVPYRYNWGDKRTNNGNTFVSWLSNKDGYNATHEHDPVAEARIKELESQLSV